MDAWGDDYEPELLEREQTDFHSLSPSHVRTLENRDVDPVVFIHDQMWPTPEACDAISFGCGSYDDDVLSTAASYSEELVGNCSGSLPPSGQEKRTSPSYNELLEVVTRNRFLTSRPPTQPRRPLPFFQVFEAAIFGTHY